MDLLQLRYFQVVARREHMTQAAKELSIAQPSLSQTIARLEEEVGTPLFDRQGRQIRLNQFGRAFLRRVERIFTELEDGRREIEDLSGLERGRIAFSVFNTPFLPDLLRAFLVDQPRVNFRLLLQHSSLEAQQQLERSEIDICITTPPISLPGIRWQPLFTEEILLMVPRDHWLAGRDLIHLREAEHELFVGLQPGTTWRDLTDDCCRRAGFVPNVAFEGDEPSIIRGLVSAGLGVGFIPELSLYYYQGEKTIASVRIEEPRCLRTMGLAWHETRYLSYAARAFREFVMFYFQQLEERLQRVKTL